MLAPGARSVVVRSARARVPVGRSTSIGSPIVYRPAPVVAGVVGPVDVAMVIVVAVIPVPVRTPTWIPELARAPVIIRQGSRPGLSNRCCAQSSQS